MKSKVEQIFVDVEEARPKVEGARLEVVGERRKGKDGMGLYRRSIETEDCIHCRANDQI